jgi:hypothetical protein
MPQKPVTSEQIKNRFLQLLNENVLNYSDELQIFEAIAKKYDMKTITNYGNSQTPKITYNGVLDRIKRKTVAYIEVDTVIFCANNL